MSKPCINTSLLPLQKVNSIWIESIRNMCASGCVCLSYYLFCLKLSFCMLCANTPHQRKEKITDIGNMLLIYRTRETPTFVPFDLQEATTSQGHLLSFLCVLCSYTFTTHGWIGYEPQMWLCRTFYWVILKWNINFPFCRIRYKRTHIWLWHTGARKFIRVNILSLTCVCVCVFKSFSRKINIVWKITCFSDWVHPLSSLFEMNCEVR